MSVAASKWAKRQRIRTTCRVVLIALADFADKQGRSWPSQATLAAETGLAIRTVRAVLSELTEAGAITREHRGNGHGGRASDLIVLSMGRDFDLLTANAKVTKEHELPADDAGNDPGGYRQITVGLAASHGRVSGTTCRGQNLSRTTKNYSPSRGTEPDSSKAPHGRPAAFGPGHHPLPAFHSTAWDDEYPFGRDLPEACVA